MSPVPSPLLPAGAVATLDRITDRLMTDTCLVKRKSTARDVGGSRVTAYGVVAAVPCQVRLASSGSRIWKLYERVPTTAIMASGITSAGVRAT